MAIVAGQVTASLRRHAEQARLREHETRLLSEQAQELAPPSRNASASLVSCTILSQALYSINLGTRTVREGIDSDPGEAIAPQEYVITLTEAGLDEVRALIFDLLPESLAFEGVIAAITKQVDVLRTRYKLSVDAQLSEEPPLSLERKQALYRIAQEALHNIVVHRTNPGVCASLARTTRCMRLSYAISCATQTITGNSEHSLVHSCDAM